MTIEDSNLRLGGWTADYPDPDSVLRQSHFYRIPRHRGWNHPRLDQLLEEAARTVDRSRRLAMYREADRILVNDEIVAVPLFYAQRGASQLLKPWVKGVRYDPSGLFNLTASDSPSPTLQPDRSLNSRAQVRLHTP